MYKQISANKNKTYFLMTFFFLLVIALGWAFSYIFNAPIILIIAVAYAIIMSWVSYFYSDKIVLYMAGAQGPIKKSDNFELYTTVENLAITAGLPMPKVCIIDDEAANAFATGRDPKHAVVAVTTGILEILKKPELEGVISHEMSHIGNRDTLLATVVVTLVGIVSLLANWGLRSLFWGRGGRRSSDGEAGVIMLIIGLALAILAPIASTLVQLAISRRREYLADASGALLTRYPEGLASALEKISVDPHKIMRHNKAISPLYIADPEKKEDRGEAKNQSWFTTLFSTHPPIKDRVKRLRGMI